MGHVRLADRAGGPPKVRSGVRSDRYPQMQMQDTPMNSWQRPPVEMFQSPEQLEHGWPWQYGRPGMQAPFEHTSSTVQSLPSSQGFPVNPVVTHPIAGSHVLVEQASLALHVTGTPVVQTPAWQMSDVHWLPVWQGAPVCAVFAQPLDGLHASVVHSLPSSQLTGVPMHVPSTQRSFVVHALPSSQGPWKGTKLQESLVGSHRSRVHGLPS